jgi:hypothetical protein
MEKTSRRRKSTHLLPFILTDFLASSFRSEPLFPEVASNRKLNRKPETMNANSVFGPLFREAF